MQVNGVRRTSHVRRASIATLRRASVGSLRSIKGYFGRGRRVSTITPENIFENGSLINAVRERVVDMVELDESKFDSRDVQRVKTSDVFVSRFVLEKLKECSEDEVVEPAAQMLVDCLKWRKEYGVNDLRAEDFPAELFNSGILCGLDTGSGDVLVFICGRRYKKITGWTDIMVQFIIYCFERIESRLGNRRVRYVMDTSGTGYAQTDISLGMSVLDIALNYYPGVVSVFNIVDLPWVCKAALSVVMRVMPLRLRELVTLCDRKFVVSELGLENLPTYMGGSAVPVELDVTRWCPRVTKSLEEVGAEQGISDKNIRAMKEFARTSAAIK